ncbi:MAG: hypothetical protein NZM25_02375 [Leptospiraceae bacterium]|nr:hypothetical protein [Leptospiraceae bacterium]MDW8307684.1 hypothetical protein [Leptospiraceae bacterium]
MAYRLFLLLSLGFSLVAQNQLSLPGFDGINWGTPYQQVKDRFVSLAQSPTTEDKVEILQDIPEREITILRKGIVYRFVFYKKPFTAPLPQNQLPPNTDDFAGNNNQNQAVFFFAESMFPLVSSEDLYQKLKDKYGERTNRVFQEKEQRGAYLWDFADGLLVQWIEPYQKKPYTRNLYYVSKKIREEIYRDLQQFQYQKELKVLQDILP